jgi:acyl-CoA thioester hydrolase
VSAPAAKGAPAAMAPPLIVRVYYEDTDFSGVVYHASYLRFMERARTELLRALGLTQSVLLQQGNGHGHGLAFAVRHMMIDFLKPARMDDLLAIETAVIAVRGASVELSQRICREGEVLVRAHVKVAAITAGRAVRLSTEIRQKLCGGTRFSS